MESRKESLQILLYFYLKKRNVFLKRKIYLIKRLLDNIYLQQYYYLKIFNLNKSAQLCNKFSQKFIPGKPIRRRIWKLDRKSYFWEEEVPLYNEVAFKEHFRMSRKSFEKLCERLQFLKRQDTNKRKAIPLEKRIAIALYALASSSEYRTVANVFGVGRTTVGEIVLEFCSAVCTTLQSEYINTYPPSLEKIREIVSGFKRLGFPQCFGAIDGCHIEISPHKDEAVDFYNFKGWYSIILFASADYKCKFTYVNVGAPGRNNDSYIFENSSLKKLHELNRIFYENYEIIENTKIPILLLGDSAFRLSKYLMKPYPFSTTQSSEEKRFNYVLSKCRRVIENAFGQLKARFRKIGRGLEVRPENSTIVIKACCILHNFLHDENDTVENNWMQELEERGNNPSRMQPQHATRNGENESDAKAIRNALTSYFSRELEEDDVDVDGNDDEPVAPPEFDSPNSSLSIGEYRGNSEYSSGSMEIEMLEALSSFS